MYREKQLIMVIFCTTILFILNEKTSAQAEERIAGINQDNLWVSYCEKPVYCSQLTSFNDGSDVESFQTVSKSTSSNTNWGSIVLEFFGGAAGGLGLGIVGGLVGESIRGNPSWECPDCGGNIGAGESFAVGCALGSSVVVYAIGNAFGENGSFRTTLAGASIPVVAGILIAEIGRDPHGGLLCGLFALFSPLGGTIGYNISRHNEESSKGKVDYYSGGIEISLPETILTTNARNGVNFSLSIVSLTF